jgi:hypothetical protein
MGRATNEYLFAKAANERRAAEGAPPLVDARRFDTLLRRAAKEGAKEERNRQLAAKRKATLKKKVAEERAKLDALVERKVEQALAKAMARTGGKNSRG